MIAGELLATYVGHSRDGRRVFGRSRDGAVRQDRGTKLAVGLGAYLGIAAAIVISRQPGLRVYANTWWTLGLGLAIVLAGTAFRDWSTRLVDPEPGSLLRP